MHNIQKITLCLIAMFTATSCLHMPCESVVLTRLCSPGGEYQAIYRSIDCGATTSTGFSVRLVESCDPELEGEPKNTIVGSERRMKISWRSADTLVVLDADTTYGHIMLNSVELPGIEKTVFVVYERS